MPKVSVIVPVYNVEKYLARCLDSITAQDFEDMEIICVNDGSTDSSPEIAGAYANFDKRIKIIDKENGGLSSARNAGIKAAAGKYILFVDSDDFISSNAVNILYKNAEKNKSDMVMFDYVADYFLQKKFIINSATYFGEKYINNPFNIDSVEIFAFKNLQIAAWSKLYRTDFIKNKISFYEDMIFEDMPFLASVYVNAKRITYIPKPLYSYSIGRIDSLISNKGKQICDVIKVYHRINKAFADAGYYEKYKSSLNLLMLMHFLKDFYTVEEKYRRKLFDECKALDMDIDYEYYLNGKFSELEKLYIKQYKLMNSLSYEEFSKIPFEVKYE